MSNFGRILSNDELQSKQLQSIRGYEDLYYVSYDGMVIRKKNHRLIGTTAGTVSLRKNKINKSFHLDEIVYSTFVNPEWDGVRKISHIDGDVNNCHADNLTCKSSIPDLPGEIWGVFMNKYEVSCFGRVKYLPTDTLCNIKTPNENSAPIVNMLDKSYRLDDIVATVFLDKDELQSVYHKDGDIHNCNLNNLSLEFCIDSEPGEVWVDVKGYEGRYKVSSFGKVYSIPRKEPRGDSYVTKGGYYLKQGEDDDGYLKVVLVDKTKTLGIFVHRLVALNFVDNPQPKEFDCINHIDGNKKNNHVDNLEWCNNQLNVDHAMISGLRDNTAYKNKNAYPTIVISPDGVKHRFESIQQASYYLDVDPELLRRYLHGETKRCKDLNTVYNVYLTSKDDFDGVVCEPPIMYGTVPSKSNYSRSSRRFVK